MLKSLVRKNHLSSVASLTFAFQTVPGSNISTEGIALMKLVAMAEQLHTSLGCLCAVPSIEWSSVKHADTGICSNGNMFSGVMNHASLCGSLTNLGLADAQETLLTGIPSAHSNVWCRRDNHIDLFFRDWTPYL